MNFLGTSASTVRYSDAGVPIDAGHVHSAQSAEILSEHAVAGGGGVRDTSPIVPARETLMSVVDKAELESRVDSQF